MHIVHDENGNPIPHGAEHANHHHHHEGGENARENLALLTYMLDHNRHHASELEDLADKLEADGMAQAAEQIRRGVKAFQEGNHYLEHALKAVRDGAEA